MQELPSQSGTSAPPRGMIEERTAQNPARVAMPPLSSTSLIPLCLCLVVGLTKAAAEERNDRPQVDFAAQIEPIFRQHCLACHGPKKQESEFRVDLRVTLLKGGDFGEPAVVPGRSAESNLIKLVTSLDSDLAMPPEGERLSEREVMLLRTWIDQGAKMPEGEATKLTTDHWSFQPVVRPEPPKHGGAWAAAEIDAFVLAKLKEAKLQPSPRAAPATLIRRLYFIMHGLPPTPEQVETFEAASVRDPQTAFHDLVRDALDSPRYGERWAQHWLDVIRFGETHGFETNRERPNAWHYRDYVIKSLNEDKPYNQFIKEQIAGDALGADVATGYLVAGPHDLVKGQDPNYRLVQRQDELADIIDTTGTTFLGLTLGCCRCHNHKFDPLTQRDYYSMQAVFAGVQHADRSLTRSTETEAKFVAAKMQAEQLRADVQRWMADQGFRSAVSHLHNVEKFPPVEARIVRFTIQETNSSQPCIDELEIFAGDRNVALAELGAKARCSSALPGHEIHKLEHINDGKYGNGRSWISNEAGAGWVEIELPETMTIDRIEWARDREGRYKDRIATRYVVEAAVEPGKWARVASSDDRLPFAADTSIAAIKFDGIPASAADIGKELFAKLKAAEQQRDELAKTPAVYAGTFSQPGPTHRLYRGDPLAKREEVMPDALEVIGTLGLEKDTPEQARRVALGEWIADPKNPLTARVMVNRIWQHHFGTGLVDTPSDFGANGTLPSHPKLLDWLADEFVRSGWSIKHIHKQILFSNTFQQSSTPRDAALAVDAASRLLWRFPPRRLEAEAIRDCTVAVSGVLDTRMGGPGFSGFEVEMENVRHFFPKKSFGPEDWRRMIYMTKVRQERDAVFGAFDCPDLSQVMPKRSRSTTPLQALNLFNSRFMLQQAELLAKRLKEEGGDEAAEQISLAFQLCFGREPDKTESDVAVAVAAEHGLVAVCRALLNSNEFLFVP